MDTEGAARVRRGRVGPCRGVGSWEWAAEVGGGGGGRWKAAVGRGAEDGRARDVACGEGTDPAGSSGRGGGLLSRRGGRLIDAFGPAVRSTAGEATSERRKQILE